MYHFNAIEPLRSSHPLLSGWLSKLQNNCRKGWELNPLTPPHPPPPHPNVVLY